MRDICHSSTIVAADDKQQAVNVAHRLLILEYGDQVKDFVVKEVYKITSQRLY